MDQARDKGEMTPQFGRVLTDHFTQNAVAGMIQVNLPTAGMDFHAPFTGRKGSSYGAPEKGSYCREFFTTAKVVHEGGR